MATHRALIGNCAEVLKTIPAESVDCCVTSPPYWGLRDYKVEPLIWDAVEGCEHDWSVVPGKSQTSISQSSNLVGGQFRGDKDISFCTTSAFCSKCGAWRGQLGLEPSPQLYIKHLVGIFDEVKRVLKPSGTCWVNLGDSYAGSWGNYGAREGKQRPVLEEHFDRPGVPSDDIIPPTINCGIAPKCLVQIPSRFALAMTDNGWLLRNEIIWHKPNCMPSSVKDRFTVDFEKLFFFTKSKRYYFEPQLEPIKDESKCRGNDSLDNKNDQFDQSPIKAASKNEWFRKAREGIITNRNKRCVWTISTKPYSGAHFAVFPPELIETPIKAGCPQNGVVLDPFGGSGTTAKVARSLGRSSIIIELNPDYLELATERALLNVPDITEFQEAR